MTDNKIYRESKEKRFFYLLLFGVETCHDGDEWYGIYNDISQLHMAYETALEESKKNDCARWEELMIYQFEDSHGSNSQGYKRVFHEELWT